MLLECGLAGRVLVGVKREGAEGKEHGVVEEKVHQERTREQCVLVPDMSGATRDRPGVCRVNCLVCSSFTLRIAQVSGLWQWVTGIRQPSRARCLTRESVGQRPEKRFSMS